MSEYSEKYETLIKMFEESKIKLCEVCTFLSIVQDMFVEINKHIENKEKQNDEEPMFV